MQLQEGKGYSLREAVHLHPLHCFRDRSMYMQKKTGSFKEGMKFKKGFRMMTLGWNDGCSFIPISFSLLASSKKENILGEVKPYDSCFSNPHQIVKLLS